MRLLTWLLLTSVAPAFAATDCGRLASLHLPSTTLTVAEVVPAGQFRVPEGDSSVEVRAFCRVAGVIEPAADSRIRFEVWMPATNWNSKFRGVGNGGFAGAIDYPGLVWAVQHGYATASTDTGHQGSGLEAGWAFQHPEKTVDFGYRAIHLTAIAAKGVISAFYSRSPAHSYFVACSNGGRQALMEAQRYPDDYDGIVAGAPANYWTHLLSNAAENNEHLSGAGYIPGAKLPAIQAFAVAECDALDGVKDGVIQDPSRCHPDVAKLRCEGSDNNKCLTSPQIASLTALYSGTHFADGAPIFPGYAPGTEAEPGGWRTWVVGTEPQNSLMYSFGTQFFKYMVFSDTYWDFRGFNLEQDTRTADQKLAAILNATDPNLGPFQARGGKLILYHGWGDAAIAPANAIDYYSSLLAKMGEAKVQQFVRLFMVPGMQHCAGGSAPNSFGQDGLSTDDPENNISVLIERWVEQDAAPSRIVAVKRAIDGDANSRVVRSRPVCAYPVVAAYKGSGSADDAGNFLCGEAGKRAK